MIEPVQIVVKAEHEYPVHIGSGSIAHLATTLFGADKIAIIYQKALVDWVQIIGAQCLEQGASVLRIEVPEGELAKSTSVLEDCWQRLGEFKFTRSDLIIGVGGGAVTDLSGFVAATWLRGVRNINIPTTLLGMVDAAVGGKTGINTAAGKNLVGSFHSPIAVICDLDTLDTLPRADLMAGMAEVVKVGLTLDPTILTDLRRDVATSCNPKVACWQTSFAVRSKPRPMWLALISRKFQQVRSGQPLAGRFSTTDIPLGTQSNWWKIIDGATVRPSRLAWFMSLNLRTWPGC